MLRSFLASVSLALFATQFGVLQIVLQGAPTTLHLVDIATSAALLCALAMLAMTRLRRAVLAGGCALLLVLQLLVFRYYHTPLDVQVMASAVFAKHDALRVLFRLLPAFLVSSAVGAAVLLVLLELAHRTMQGASNRTGLPVVLAVATLGGLFGDVPRRGTPEVRALHSLTALRMHHEIAHGGAVPLPELVSDRAELPNILFVLTESVRAADYTTETAPEAAALLPGRTDLHELRAVSSYTALSLSAVVTGRAQTGPRDAITASPSLFDFAHAARDPRGTRPFVAYFSAQSETVFETDGVRGAVDRFATVETFRGRDVEDDADYVDLPLDREMVDLFERSLAELPLPTVTMLHFAGTHAPYFVDPARAPFTPYDHSVAWSGMARLLNAYRDSIYEQDRTFARALRAFFTHVGARPWIVVFTSDHGEAFGENGAIHHGQNLLDEQVHVPAFFASGNGALTEPQSRALADHTGRFATHLDLVPTMLDALGLWDNSAVAPYRARLPGKSLLRAWEPRAAIAVTNCTPMFQCPANTWGFYDGDRKLLARVYDSDWRCFALGSPAGERLVDGHDATCERLRSESKSAFPLLPNGTPNR